MKGVAKFVTLAVAAIAAAGGSAKAMDMAVQEEHFAALASQLANAQAVNIDLEPLLEGKMVQASEPATERLSDGFRRASFPPLNC